MAKEEEEELRAMELTTYNRLTDMTSFNLGQGRSMSSLTMVIGCLDNTNQEVVNIILHSKKHIDGSQKLLELLRDYFRCNQKIIEFLKAIHMWLHGGSGVIRRVKCLKSALEVFKEDKSKLVHVETTRLNVALEKFLNTNDSLSIETLRAKLSSVLEDQKCLCERLQAKKYEVDYQNMGRLRFYRRLTTAVLFSTYMGLFACAITTAILSPPLVAAPIAVIAAIASMNPTEYTRTWINRLLAKFKDTIRRRGEVVNELMEANSQMKLDELEEIRSVVQDLRNKIQNLSGNISPMINVRKDSDVSYTIKNIEKKVDEFVKVVNDLESKKNKCYKDVTKAKVKIIKTACS